MVDMWSVFMLLLDFYLLDILIASEEFTYSRGRGKKKLTEANKG